MRNKILKSWTGHNFRRSLSLIILPPAMIFVYSIRNPNWFTTFPISIDPWIYWGAGDNLRLSYLNGFENTYYLQRLTLILPQALLQNILGPYWSQLVLSLLWLSITLVAIWFLVRDTFIFLGITTILILDRTVMGAFGMSYSQATSIGLMLASLASMCFAVESTQRKVQRKPSSQFLFTLSGVFAGGLMNAYSPIAAIFIPCLILSYLFLTCDIRHLKKVVSSLTHFFLGAGVVSLVIQIFYTLKFNSQRIILLQQLYLGQNLVRHKNSWGGEAGMDGFYAKVMSAITYHWWLGVLIFILALILTIRESRFSNLNLITQFLILYSTISSLVILLSHFTYSSFVGYSWTAVVLVLPELTGVYLLLIFYKDKLNLRQKSLVFTIFFLITALIINDSQVMSGKYLNQLIIFSLLISFLLFVELLRKPRKEKAISIRTTFGFILIILSLMTLRSMYLAFAGDLAGGGKNAKSTYYQVSEERSLLLELNEATNSKYRIWLTPDNSTPLVSSMLFAYSLISTEKGQAQCSQVKWAASTNSIVATFVESQKIEDIEKTYLAECGFALKEIETEKEFDDFMANKGLEFGVLQRIA